MVVDDLYVEQLYQKLKETKADRDRYYKYLKLIGKYSSLESVEDFGTREELVDTLADIRYAVKEGLRPA